MAKKITKMVKIQLPAGKATPAPPVGTALGPTGINIGEFVNQFNTKTRDQMGSIIPAIITIFEDRSFTFIMKKPPASQLLLKAAGKEKGSGKVPTEKAGKITKAQLAEIAAHKMEDLNANSQAAAERIIAGTARSMGIDVA
ncbi:MAG: 50S ribosomal protein L11 [Parcubacteria group bacterium]|nr:50S ribosomal protein L11 [Parcubacteria group bacterium]